MVSWFQVRFVVMVSVDFFNLRFLVLASFTFHKAIFILRSYELPSAESIVLIILISKFTAGNLSLFHSSTIGLPNARSRH